MDHYTEWIQLVADFTVNSLQSWQWASGSVFYLLGLWSRLVSSMPYLKSDAPSLLETYVPKITEAYITSRCLAFRCCGVQIVFLPPSFFEQQSDLLFELNVRGSGIHRQVRETSFMLQAQTSGASAGGINLCEGSKSVGWLEGRMGPTHSDTQFDHDATPASNPEAIRYFEAKPGPCS